MLRALALGAVMLLAAGAARADDEYDRCVQATATNAGYSTCGSALIAREEKQLNATWQHVVSLLRGHSRADLLTEQRAWNAYKKQSCRVYANGTYGRDGVVIHYPVCRAAVIAQRTKELEAYGKFFATP